MYKRILVAVENSPADEAILSHIVPLAKLTGAELLVVHVADGFAARHFDDLNLRESDEMKADRAYLASVLERLSAHALKVTTELALGDPASELRRVAESRAVDLIAMATHGHRLVGDLIHGSTVNRLRHEVRIPVLLVRAV